MNILQCHSRGDTRFSPFYAKLQTGESLEDIYQRTRRGLNGAMYPKEERERDKPCYSVQVGKTLVQVSECPTILYDWLLALWMLYFQDHPSLLEEASKYDGFLDIFDGIWMMVDGKGQFGRVHCPPLISYPFPGQTRACQSAVIAWLVQHKGEPPQDQWHPAIKRVMANYRQRYPLQQPS